MRQVALRVDGRPVEVAEGTSILRAAAAAGVAIPTLCDHPALPPDGSCRLCLVQIEGRPGLHPACITPAQDGLGVRTGTPGVGQARRHALALLLRRYRPGVGRRDNELLALAARLGVPVPSGHGGPVAQTVDDGNPFIRVDPGACVHCWRCLRACERLNGVAAIGVFGRGEAARIGFGAGGAMHESPCEFCGMCEAVCPTDALTARPAGADGAGPGPERLAPTLCSYCGVGCGLRLRVAGDRVVSAEPDWTAPANHGLLCVKGRFGWAYTQHPDRLTRPRVRRRLLGGRGEDLVETDWDTALDIVARTLLALRDRHGPEALGFLASAKCTNEENYLVQRLARGAFGTNNVDHCARLCHAPTVAALGRSLGSGAMTNTFDDILACARSVLVVGSNTTEQHPVFGMRLRAAARTRGLPIVVADPRRVPLAEVAALHLPLRPGTDLALLNALAHELLAQGWVDREFLAAHTDGLDTLAEALREETPERAAVITGVPADDIRRAARLLWEHRPGALLFAMGITQHTCGTDNAQACVNLQLLLGNLGRPGAGVNPLRGQNNVQGACDMGALPDLLPGYKPVADPEARGRLEADWRVRIPERPGLTVTEIVDAAGRGTIRGLYVLGENVAMTDPDLGHVHRCLAACEFLVVQEIFLSETARFAHVVLPGAAAAEKAGTFTNTERRVQLLAPAVPPPGQARPDWWIVAEIGRRVARLDPGPGRALAWPYGSPAEILEEVARLAPIYGGISHARLGRESLHWPCPGPEHPGTPILHVGGPVRGRGLLRPVPHRPPAEEPDAEFPLVLTTGRILPHYHGGTMTRRVAGLEWRQPEAFVEMHPADAAALGLGDGTAVTLRSRRGSLTTRLRVTPGIAPGTVFMPFHYAEAAANVLTHAALDPVARIPEFKVSAVAVEAAGDPAAEAPAAVLRPAHPP